MSKQPKTMKALVLEEFGGTPILKDIPIPKPRHNEVLIKIEYSPLNPMDLSFLKGYYSSVKKLPVTIGFEGCGTVVASGGNKIRYYIKMKIQKFMFFFSQFFSIRWILWMDFSWKEGSCVCLKKSTWHFCRICCYKCVLSMSCS